MNRSTVSHCRYGFSYFDISVLLYCGSSLGFIFLAKSILGFLMIPRTWGRICQPLVGPLSLEEQVPMSHRPHIPVVSPPRLQGPGWVLGLRTSFTSSDSINQLIILVDHDHGGQSMFHRTRSHRRCIDGQISWGRLRRSWEGRLPRCDY